MLSHEVIKNTRRLEIYTRRLVDSLFAGEYFSIFKGRGIEFHEIREYQPGDDIRDIDWKVTARMGSPFVRRYIEERELSVILLVDGSASMLFGTGGKTKRDVVLELCAFLGMSAIKKNNRLGLAAFTDKIELFCPPRKGRNNFYNLIGKLFAFQQEIPPNPPFIKGGQGGFGTDIKCGLEYLDKVVKRSSLVFLISDFLSQSFTSILKIADRRHDIIPVVVSDPREYTLPRGHFIELIDYETGERVLIDSADKDIRHKFYLLSMSRKKEIEGIFRSIGLDYITVSTAESYIKPIKELFYRRAGRRR